MNVLKALTHFRWWILYLYLPVLLAKVRYALVLPRIRRAYGKRPLKVGFVVGNMSKWKAQSLYDLMCDSNLFVPCIVLTICDVENTLDSHRKAEHLEAMERYFKSKDMNYVVAYSRQNDKCMDINDFGFDLVFYHQPWGVAKNQLPHYVARRSLTAYIQYFVPNYGDCKIDCDPPFMRTLFWFCTLSAGWANDYEQYLKGSPFACRFLPVGHTALDYFTLNNSARNGEYVIYAPHWSIDCEGNENAENFSTFLWSGAPILQYAKAHPEIKWVFKPHPTLRHVLVKSGVWSEEQVSRYYADWESVALACYHGDYQELFMNSRAMITDCGSFLSEFVCTGSPIVHLISSTCKIKAFPVSEKLFATYYQVHDLEELTPMLDMVVLNGSDPQKAERMKNAREAGLLENYAAQNIMNELKNFMEASG